MSDDNRFVVAKFDVRDTKHIVTATVWIARLAFLCVAYLLVNDEASERLRWIASITCLVATIWSTSWVRSITRGLLESRERDQARIGELKLAEARREPSARQ